jgi:hypothetical protein
MNHLRLLSLCLCIALLGAIISYYYFGRDRDNQAYESVDSPSSESLDEGALIDSSTENTLEVDASDDELNQRIADYSNDVDVLIDEYDQNLASPMAELALREKLENSEKYKKALLEKFRRENGIEAE